MKYRLKTGVPDFTVVDGPMEGRSFNAGEIYDDVPPQEKHKFEVVQTVQTDQADETVQTAKEGGKKK